MEAWRLLGLVRTEGTKQIWQCGHRTWPHLTQVGCSGICVLHVYQRPMLPSVCSGAAMDTGLSLYPF